MGLITKLGYENGFSFPFMIDLSIAMKRLFLVFLLLTFIPHQVHAQEEPQLAITSPQEGQVVQGQVVISGSVTVLGFSSYELAFAYADDSTQTWFDLESSSSPIFESQLGTWDTSTLTDGDYNLRLRVFLLDGMVQETTVTGLRVRNYTPVPTATPTVTPTTIARFAPPTAQLIAPAPATVTPSLPTPTPLPPNPASLTGNSISGALGRGAALALLLFLGFGLVLRLRRE